MSGLVGLLDEIIETFVEPDDSGLLLLWAKRIIFIEAQGIAEKACEFLAKRPPFLGLVTLIHLHQLGEQVSEADLSGCHLEFVVGGPEI